MNKKKVKIDRTNESQEYWERILTQEGFDMKRGGMEDPQQVAAIKGYLIREQLAEVSEEEIADGFQQSDTEIENE